MWADVETNIDMLNFTVVANTAAQLILDSDDEPLSIGISGGWGVGKSSLVKMIRFSLENSESTVPNESKKYIFVDFNAWLYQGYEEAKIALLQVVADKLLDEANLRQTYVEKAKDFVKRIQWLKCIQFLYPIARNFSIGAVVAGPVGGLVGAATGMIESKTLLTGKEFKQASDNVEAIGKEVSALISEKENTTLPKEIDGLRKSFAEILETLNVRLVVVVDDLDRCLPQTAISTLEAMRLLLFMPRSSFIIAADEEMIRSAVRVHFGQVQITDSLVTSYFDKLIQVPLRVPRLGINEVKAYLALLFGEFSKRKGQITAEEYNSAKDSILNKLKKPWEGSLSYDFLKTSYNNKDVLLSRLSLADEIAGFLTSSDGIAGNPRLIKRFMNNLLIRERIATAQGMGIDFELLVKIQLFERCASSSEFEYFSKIIVESDDGMPEEIIQIEEQIRNGEEVVYPSSYHTDFCKKWFTIKPELANKDLRPYLYLSQDRSINIAQGQELSRESQEILAAIISAKNYLPPLNSSIQALTPYDAKVILKQLIKNVRVKQFTKESLACCLNITRNFPDLSPDFVSLLKNIPFQNVKAPLVPTFKNETWAMEVFSVWKLNPQVPQNVKNAIDQLNT